MSWELVLEALEAGHAVVKGLVGFCNLTGAKKTGETYNGHLTRYKEYKSFTAFLKLYNCDLSSVLRDIFGYLSMLGR